MKNDAELSGWKMPGLIFKKYWFWFDRPVEVKKADLVNFFCYDNIDEPGFHKRAGLTTVIDLGQSLEQIWSKMRQGFIGKQIKRGEKNDIVVKLDDNFKAFKKIYFRFRKSKQIEADNYKFLSRHGMLFSAYHENRLIAGGIFVARHNFLRAWVLASIRLDEIDGRMREIAGQANRLVIWEAIKYGKKNNFKSLDLGGIDPESSNKGEKTLAEFKEAFGGERKKAYYYYKVNSRLLNFLMRLKGYKNL